MSGLTGIYEYTGKTHTDIIIKRKAEIKQAMGKERYREISTLLQI